jgi:N-acetylglucosaminyldiphosphoundecaprenol N-acetyl-beta-D-mannosaminyltransferase
MTTTQSFLGQDFACLPLRRAAERIAGRPKEAPLSYVVTPNADHLVRLSRDASLRNIYRRAGLCLLDSQAVSLLARLLRLSAPPVVRGSDLAEHLLTHHLLPGERIAIIGLSPVWLPALMARFDLAPPAHYDPPPGFDRNPVELARIEAFLRAYPARFIFLAVGSPRQEILAHRLARLPDLTGTALCIGAGLEFLCGAHRRAPALLRASGLEWAWRLAGEPRRLGRRYLLDSPRVIGLLMRQRLNRRSQTLQV